MKAQRRQFLHAGAAAGTLLATGRFTEMLAAQEPPTAIKREGTRPQVAQGVASGDVAHDRAIIWSRCDRPARMVVEWAAGDPFADRQRMLGPAVIEATDFTGKIDLRGLPPGENICFRVLFQDLRDLKTWSEPVEGAFVTPPAPDGQPRDVTIAFTGDVAGQGWGIDPARGGMRMFETMRAAQPDLFIHLGDTIYADNPIEAEVKLEDGTLWKNITSEQKSHVAQSLDDFRGAYRYNLLDENVRRFTSVRTLVAFVTAGRTQ
jgi:alkaline phosphatase D